MSQGIEKKGMGSDRVGSMGTILRIAVVAVALLLQITLLLILTRYLRMYATPIYLAFDVLAVLTVLTLINKHDSPAYRMMWIILLLVAPIFGICLYWAWGRVDFNKREKGNMKAAFDDGFALLAGREVALDAFQARYPHEAPYARGLAAAGYPLYTDTEATYFPLGEAYFDRLIADLEAAQRFILIEYFIVAEGQLWDRVHDVLLRKIQAGVEVRLFYDDVGCFFKIPSNFDRLLQQEGFRVAVFSPAHRFVSNFYLNYRNHQKIVVIDGRVGYTGGVNLADEYINVDSKLGHWKDTGIRLEGSAVRSLSVIFFQMWNIATHGADKDYAGYLLETPCPAAGYYQPYADGPANNPKNPALDLIRQAVSGARDYIWLTSPYLVIDQDLIAEFGRAARGGVDVRIVTPAVPDHWYVGLINRYNYRFLLEDGVRIYEYTPGFIHGKLLVADDRYGTVGSVNLDFRSLYLHYECGVFFCDTPAVMDVKHDIEAVLAASREITLEDVRRRPWYQKALAYLFNLFSPLM